MTSSHTPFICIGCGNAIEKWNLHPDRMRVIRVRPRNRRKIFFEKNTCELRHLAFIVRKLF